MNKRKKILWAATLTMLSAGFVLLAIPFASALKPNATANQALPRIDVGLMKPGEIASFDGEQSKELSWRYIIYKDYESKFAVFVVPVRDGNVLMPDLTWERPGFPCSDFGPTLSEGALSILGVYLSVTLPLSTLGGIPSTSGLWTARV